MLKQGSLEELRAGVIGKTDGWLALTTRFYPRFLKPSEVDEYISDLAPSRQLLAEFKRKSEAVGHNAAFLAMDYQKKFVLTAKGHERLKLLTVLGQERDVYLLCYCKRDEYCHRELLMLTARERYGAKVDQLVHKYPEFLKRVSEV
jgi:uncharacterized protein YeaO (DUF488 family)